MRFFFSVKSNMPVQKKVKKSVPPKILKVQKKKINDDPNNFVIRYRGDWDKKLLKEFKEDLNYFCQQYLAPQPEKSSEQQKYDEEEKRPIL